MSDLSIRQAVKVMKKFRVNDGDIILVKSETELSSDDNMRALASGLKMLEHKHTIILIVDNFDDIKAISEDVMAKYGWYRVETLRNKILKLAKKTEEE